MATRIPLGVESREKTVCYPIVPSASDDLAPALHENVIPPFPLIRTISHFPYPETNTDFAKAVFLMQLDASGVIWESEWGNEICAASRLPRVDEDDGEIARLGPFRLQPAEIRLDPLSLHTDA